MKVTASLSSRVPISLAFYGFALSGINESANGVLIPSLTAFYGVNNAVIGVLFFVSSAGYFLSALNSGFLTQRLGLRWLLLIGAILFLIGMLAFGLRLPFALLLPARFVLGLSIGLIETGANIYITALPRSTLLLNYLHAFYGVGGLIGPTVASGILALQLGWNSVYIFQVILGLLLLLGFGFFFRPLNLHEPAVEERLSSRENLLGVSLKIPIVWLSAIFLLMYVGVEVSVGDWSYSFLLQNRHEAALLAGWIVGGYWLGLTLGRFLLQNLAERVGIRTKGLMSICIIGLGIGLLLLWSIPIEIVAVPAFFFVGFSLGPIYPLTVAIVPKLVPAHLGPSVIGFLVSVSIVGLAIFPWLAGVLAQLFGIWTLLPYVFGLTVVVFVIWRMLVYYAGPAFDF